TGSQWTRPGGNIAVPTGTAIHDVLIGGAGSDTLYAGKGSDVLHGGYVASEITGVLSSWDAAGQFTDTHNSSGTALTDLLHSADGYDYADYSHLYYSDATKSITVNVYSSSATVDKGASGADGQDTLFSIEEIVGTAGDDQFIVHSIQ